MASFLAPLLLALGLATIAAAPPPAAAFTIHIKNFAFVPASLAVPAGATVTFVDDDEEPHTATAVDKSFDSEAIDTNGTWTHTFASAGTHAYYCELHPMMKGTLVVSKAVAP